MSADSPLASIPVEFVGSFPDPLQPLGLAYLFDAFIEMMKTKQPVTGDRLAQLQSMREKGEK